MLTIGNGNKSDILSSSSSFSNNQWKIFIYDTPGRAIISPQMSVTKLRRQGVTLHLPLDAGKDGSARERIDDVPAVYFCKPTRENLMIIAKDLEKSLYDRVYLNFLTKLQRAEMEMFAKLAVQTNTLNKIASVTDQYLDYVCLENQLFTLNKPRSYVQYNQPNQTDASMEAAMDDICYGLFSVICTLSVLPIIRCARGGAPEMVARKLNRMIAEQAASGTSKMSSLSRPLLVIMDRNSDLVTPLQHNASYQALVDDVLQHASNRVNFVVKEDKGSESRSRKSAAPQKKTYDLDADGDPFYSKYKFSPFPEAIESNGSELDDVTEKEKEVRSKTTTTTSNSAMGAYEDSSAATDLASAVESLPALLERKKQLEVHTSILQAVMNEVAARDIPVFYELENAFATGTYKNDLAKGKKAVLEIVSDYSKGNIEDKLRLIAVFALATTAPSSDVDDLVGALRSLGEAGEEKGVGSAGQIDAGTKAIDYLKKLRSLHMISTMAFTDEQSLSTGSGGTPSLATLGNFMAKAQTQATGLLAKATERVGSLLGKTHKNQLTCVVENLCEMKPNSEDESYLYLDPKIKGDIDVSALRGIRAPVREVMAFMIGGGCYSEYQNLQLVSNNQLKITYGSTELVDSSVFLTQLAECA